MILVGDIGGSKTRLAIFEPSAVRTEALTSTCIDSAGHDSLESVLELFLDLHPTKVRAAVFGVAGPVVDGASRTTHLSWTIRESSLARQLGTRRVVLVNDLAATARGLTTLRDD